jgi:hypothetical protein
MTPNYSIIKSNSTDDGDILSPEARERQQKGLSIEGMGFTRDPDEGINLDDLDDAIMQILFQRAIDKRNGVDRDLEQD